VCGETVPSICTLHGAWNEANGLSLSTFHDISIIAEVIVSSVSLLMSHDNNWSSKVCKPHLLRPRLENMTSDIGAAFGFHCATQPPAVSLQVLSLNLSVRIVIVISPNFKLSYL